MFPRDKGKMIDTRLVMVVDAIFKGIRNEGKEKKYYSLALVILDNIYLSLSLCKNGFPFFQGCNILLQWLMTKHLCKRDDKPHELDKP